MIKAVVLNAIWNICFIEDGRNAEGKLVAKDFFPKNQYKAALSLRKKIADCVKTEGETTLISEGDFTLTDSEKDFVADCVKDRSEIPVLDEATIEAFKEATGVDLVA